MKIYLVDFENVKSKGLEGIDKLEETDNVIIFFSENSDTLSFEMHQKVLSSKADIEYFKVSVGGKNALDFQLSTLLGFMVAKETYTHIFVISNDKGFDFLHAFWCGKYIDAPSTLVYRTRTIKGAIEYESIISEQERLEENIEEIQLELDNELEQAEPQPQPEQPQQAVAETEAEPLKQEKAKKQPAKKAKRSKARSFDEMFSELLEGTCETQYYDNIRSLFIASETKEEFHNSLAKIYKQQGSDIYKAIKSRYLKLKDKYLEENPEASAPIPEPEKTPDKLTELLAGLCEPSDIETIRQCIGSTASKKDFYISMVKQFQRKKGCEYYNAVKPHYNEFIKQMQEC